MKKRESYVRSSADPSVLAVVSSNETVASRIVSSTGIDYVHDVLKVNVYTAVA